MNTSTEFEKPVVQLTRNHLPTLAAEDFSKPELPFEARIPADAATALDHLALNDPEAAIGQTLRIPDLGDLEIERVGKWHVASVNILGRLAIDNGSAEEELVYLEIYKRSFLKKAFNFFFRQAPMASGYGRVIPLLPSREQE